MPASKKTEYTDKPSLLNLGHLLDDVARQTTDDSIDFPSQFSFIWHNIQFAGQVLRSKKGDDQFSINLVANLGYIPFSAEDCIRRKKLIETFTPLFMKGEYRLSTNSQIQMILLTNFTGPVNARRLMEAITYTLLDLQADLKSIQASIAGRLQ